MFITESKLYEVIKPRKKKSHKNHYGRVLLIGGNAQYSGAIIMAASACVASGAGLVTVASSAKTHLPLLARLPEVMFVDWQNESSLITQIEKAGIVLIGCGLGEDDFALKQLTLTLENITNQTLIIDASAINLMAAHRQLLNFLPQKCIFTPHQKELERLSQIPILLQTNENIQAFTERIAAIIVAKSDQTTIFAPNQPSQAINNGTPAMATGGVGDTLAGMITAFVGQFSTNLLDAVLAATFLHSQIASDLAVNNYVVLPTKISKEIPRYMAKYAKVDTQTTDSW